MNARRILVGMTGAMALLSMACSDAGGVSRRDGGTVTPPADGGTITLPDGRVIRPDAGTVTPRPDGGGVPTGAVVVQAGLGHVCALKTATGQVYCWGANKAKQSGVAADVDEVHMPNEIAGLTAETLSVGSSTGCSVVSGGGVKCFGSALFGMLGNGEPGGLLDGTPTPVDVGLTGVTQVDVGGTFVCAVHSGGQVACWGSNTSGQIGIDPDDRTMCDYSSSGGSGRECRSPEPFPGLENVVSVHAGFSFGCAVLADRSVRCFGSNAEGQLGDGNGGCPDPMGNPYPPPCNHSFTPVQPTGLGAVEQLCAGGSFACGLLSDGTVKCWGRNDDGQIGDGIVGTSEDRYMPTAVVGLSNVRSVACGTDHACALLADGTVSCWGSGSDGRNGTTTGDTGTPTPVPGLADIVQLDAHGPSCAASSTGDVYCWGSNNNGQLGGGSDMPGESATPVRVLGL